MEMGNNSNQILKNIIERVNDRLDAADVIKDEIKEIYGEAKDAGLDPKALRVVIKRMREDADKRRELEEMVEIYTRALGDLSDTPLGRAAIETVMRAG